MAIADQRPLSVNAAIGQGAPPMLDIRTMELMHVHEGEHVPMVERPHHDPADHDPEQRWREGARIFRCTTCDEEVVVLPPGLDGPRSDQT